MYSAYMMRSPERVCQQNMSASRNLDQLSINNGYQIYGQRLYNNGFLQVRPVLYQQAVVAPALMPAYSMHSRFDNYNVFVVPYYTCPLPMPVYLAPPSVLQAAPNVCLQQCMAANQHRQSPRMQGAEALPRRKKDNKTPKRKCARCHVDLPDEEETFRNCPSTSSGVRGNANRNYRIPVARLNTIQEHDSDDDWKF